MQPGIGRVVGGGVLGTVAMTAVGLHVAPLIGMPAMNPANMLAGQMGGNLVLGWMGHVMIGVILGAIYARGLLRFIPGPAAVRGAAFSIGPWLMAQLMVMPMMGMPLFSGSMEMAGGSLVGHLVYGAVLGVVVGLPAAEPTP